MARSTALARSITRPTEFNAFYAAHSKDLLRFFARRTFDPEAAADLTAETFAQAYQSRRRFRGHSEQEAAGWLYAIAHRQLGRYCERGVRERKALERLGLQRPILHESDYERIEDLAGFAELRDLITAGLGQLSPETRLALELRIVDELPYNEIAERLDISEPAARARVSRALRGLFAHATTEALT